jgi:hypothetical protein
LWTICLGWPQTAVLLISASWVARITGMSHWHPEWPFLLSVKKSYMMSWNKMVRKKVQYNKNDVQNWGFSFKIILLSRLIWPLYISFFWLFFFPSPPLKSKL